MDVFYGRPLIAFLQKSAGGVSSFWTWLIHLQQGQPGVVSICGCWPYLDESQFSIVLPYGIIIYIMIDQMRLFVGCVYTIQK